MKNYKKGILTLAVLASMSLFSAEDTTIHVNTFDDEDVNNDKCSLREAVIAASLHRAYNGCSGGVPANTTASNVIQLEAGDYNLTSEIQPNSPVIIQGKAPEDWSKRDLITNEYPAKLPIKTNIIAPNSRHFNTTNRDRPLLVLNNLHLKQGRSSGNGGSLNLGGSGTLTNVWISDAQAQKGGAIYLDGVNSALTISGGQFSGNKANSGSVVEMSCYDSLGYTRRSLSFVGSSYLDNGSSTDQSIFNFCGESVANFESNTITQNTVNSTSGHLIKFYSEIVGNVPNFSDKSSLAIKSNTIVRNTGKGIVSYDNTGTKSFNFNIIGFNTGRSCLYVPGDAANTATANLKMSNNAVNLTVGNDHCELPKDVLEDTATKSVDLNGKVFENLLSPLYSPVDFTNYLSMYFPKNLANDSDLVDSGNSSCIKVDQRGFARIVESETSNTPAGVIIDSCDIGAVEVLRFALNNQAQTNVSLTVLIESYKNEIDLFKDIIADKTTPAEFLPFYQIRLAEFTNRKERVEANTKYRPIYFDPFVGNVPDEIVNPDGGRKIQNFTLDNYTVNAPVVSGIGKIDPTTKQFVGIFDSNLKCEWDSQLERYVMYRIDDRLTPSGDFEVCEYSLTSKVAPFKTEKGYLSGIFANIAPNVSGEVSYVVEHGQNQIIKLDLLKGANDDGDGATQGLTTRPDKSPFYLNNDGKVQAIRFSKLPSSVVLRSEVQGACPGESRFEICHGGEVSLQLANTLDPFNYDIEYMIYDVEGAQSGTGLIRLRNTAVAKDSVRISGGGSFGWFTGLTLLGVAVIRYRRKTKINTSG